MKFYDKDKVCVLGSEVDGPGKEAASKLEQAGWDVYRLSSTFTIEIGPMAQAGGGVHCVTQQQPK